MEPLFKNKTILSSKNYMNLVAFHQKKYNLRYWLYTIALSLLLICCAIFQISAQNYLLAILLFASFIFFLAYRFIYPYYKTGKELHSNKVQNNLINYFFFYENYFRIKNTIGNSKLKYRDLYRVYENDNYFYLYMDKSNALIIEKSGFVIGTAHSFRTFIKNKVGFKFKKD